MNASLLKKILPHIIAVAVFLIVAIIYGKPALDGKVVSQSDVIGWKGTAQQSFEYKEKNGHFPLWSESTFSGMPGYTFAMDATSKIATGYLTYLVTFGLPKPICFFFLACICFYILSQVLRIDPWIGIMAALSYGYATFNPILVAVGHETELYAIGYAPAVIASVLLIYQRKYLLGAALLSIFFGFQVSTQHVQVIYYTGIMLGFITVAFLIYSWKQKELKNAFLSVAIAVIAGLLGFGTYAVSLLPLQEYSKETMRGGKTELTNVDAKNKTKGGLNKDYAFDWSYGIPETFTLIVPGIYGGGSDGKQITGNSKFAEKAAELGMPEENALRAVNIYSYWGAQQRGTSGPVYLGAIICFLFILGIVYVKSWHKWWILSAAILGILMAWGKNFSVFNYFLFDYLPFYNKFRAPTIALVMPQLVFPLLAALGLQQVLFNKESKQITWQKLKPVAYITGGLLVVLCVLYFTADFKGANDNTIKNDYTSQLTQSMARGKQPTPEMQQQANATATGLIKGLQEDRQSIFGYDLIRTIVLISLAALLIGLYLKDKIKPVIVIAGLILLSGYDLLAEGRVYLNEDNFVEPTDSEASFSPTQADIQISKDPDKNFRVFDQGAEQGFTNDSHVSYHHNSVGGYSPAKLGLYQDIIENQLMKGNILVFNMLNTKYFIQRNPQNGQQAAMLNPNAFGPCWLVKNIHYVKDGDEEMKALDSINVRDTAIVQQKYEKYIKFLPQFDSTATLTLLHNNNDTVTYKFSAKTNQFAVFSEVYYDKGWNAYTDGTKTDYCKVNYILRGMAVPAGDHTIEFRFEPAVYKLSNTITVLSSIIAYLLLIAAVVVAWRKKDQPV
jgi:membrane protein YfhO